MVHIISLEVCPINMEPDRGGPAWKTIFLLAGSPNVERFHVNWWENASQLEKGSLLGFWSIYVVRVDDFSAKLQVHTSMRGTFYKKALGSDPPDRK